MSEIRSEFLLTRPSRDVTWVAEEGFETELFLLTRPSRDVTFFWCCSKPCVSISTHTSLAGRDKIAGTLNPASTISTHTSLAGRDIPNHNPYNSASISTHTSLAGRDGIEEIDGVDDDDFYSHVPRGT